MLEIRLQLICLIVQSYVILRTRIVHLTVFRVSVESANSAVFSEYSRTGVTNQAYSSVVGEFIQVTFHWNLTARDVVHYLGHSFVINIQSSSSRY